jgi:UDP-N-acetylglucosamine 4,6-dehydratase/UDP-glucose 4-epimerase|tara:strand:+ start:4798 stop:5652 length:855 start_codon:yes stop_codon:yes gene_type:complete
MKIKRNNLYLVTGGSGFLGFPLVESIIKQGGRVRVLARDEGKLVDLKEKFPSVEIYPGDVADRFEVRQAMEGVSGVFHLAASKHVGLAETYVRENVKSNTLGSLNILEESLTRDLDFVLGISTDKAAQVAGVYGATKLLMERLFHQFENMNPNCQYRIVRYGNVLYSTGSVLCKWKVLIEQGKEVIVTEPSATRFFWTVDQAIQLIMDCLEFASDSKPYCPSMKAMSVDNLLKAMIQKYSKGQEIPIKVIGLQPGENLHEKVMEAGPYSNEADQFTVEDIISLI